jgi:hypothetical protein
MSTKPKPTSTDSQLKEIANVPEVVKAFGKEYKIAKFTLGQLAAAMEYAGYIGVLIVQASKLPPAPTTADIISFVTQGIGVSSPAIMGLISIATHEPIEWLEEQDAMDGLEIFAKVVEQNRGFFTQENIDRAKALFGGLLPETPAVGTEASTT